ncbi:MAG TPA: VOC family protein [Candidatus Binataceae bacterium]|nr:VOC family protein [Candidatus Binataceae bacterium]
MPGRIDHLMINVNRFDDAVRFYSWLMPALGYSNTMSFPPGGKQGSGWWGDGGSVWVQETAAPYRGDSFHRHRVGLCEIAFGADSRDQVDALAREIEPHGGAITAAPHEYDYLPGYYSVFFTDPDGLKLELVHIPRGARTARGVN